MRSNSLAKSMCWRRWSTRSSIIASTQIELPCADFRWEEPVAGRWPCIIPTSSSRQIPAGFSETPEFLKSFQHETLAPAWYEQKLWRWYDCPGYCVNLYNLPTVAYSGELDIQKQAADVMEAALAQEDISLVHLIGPQTKHAIHPDSAQEIERRLASLAEGGRDRLQRV